MLVLYRIVLLVLLILIAISFAQGAKSLGKNGFIWACIGLGIFILCGIFASLPIYYFSQEPSIVLSIVSSIVVIGIPLLITILLRKKFLPGTPLISMSNKIPITLIFIITICMTLFLIANELNGSLLADIVTSNGLRGMRQVANAKGALIIASVIGWALIVGYFVMSKLRK